MTKRILLFYTLLIMSSLTAFTQNDYKLPDSLLISLQNNSNHDVNHVESLADIIDNLIINNRYEESKRYIDEMSDISGELKNDYVSAVTIFYENSYLFFTRNAYKECINQLLNAKNMLEPLNNSEKVMTYKIRISNLLGICYSKTQMYSESYQCYEKSIEINKILQDKNIGSVIMQNMLVLQNMLQSYPDKIRIAKELLNNPDFGDNMKNEVYFEIIGNYMNINAYDTASMYIDTVMKRANSNHDKAMALALKGCNLNGLERYNEAKMYLKKCLSMPESNHNQIELYCCGHISISYYQLEEYDSAFYYIDEAFNKAKEYDFLDWQIYSLEQKCDFLREQEMYKDFADNIIIYNKLNDSLKELQNLNDLDKIMLRKQYKEMEEQLQKKIEENRIKQYKLVIFIIILAASATIAITLLLLNRKNILLKSKKIKEEALSKELEMRNRELASNVVILMKKNEVFADIVKRLHTIKDNAVKDETKDAIDRITKDIEKTIEGKFWEEFEMRFKNVHSDFYNRLMKKYPDLTPSEVRLCSFLKLDLSTKDISSITGQSVPSIEKARNRLRKKFGIATGENINMSGFIQKI